MTSARPALFALFGLAVVSACHDDDPELDDVNAAEAGSDTGVGGGGVHIGPGGRDTGAGDGHGQAGIPDPADALLPDAGDYDYTVSVQFHLDDVVGDFLGTQAGDDPSILCTTGCEDDLLSAGGFDMYPVDSAFGFEVEDFVGHWQKTRDGDFAEGWVGEIGDEEGAHWGLAVSNIDTDFYKTGSPEGSWCAGMGQDFVKCSTEHFVAMEHVLTCDETVPYMFADPVTGEPLDDAVCEALDTELMPGLDTLTTYSGYIADIAVTADYGVTLKDDGKLLYRWGTYEKRPNDVRIQVALPLPDEWDSGEYRVTRAELSVVHTITNNPNDQIRPEDMENEGATGRKPSYEVDADGNWRSTIDCFEADGDPLPAGTLLRNVAWADPNGASSDLIGGFTNAWYTTLDRNPFETDPFTDIGPRWRLRANKFGQDIPGVEIPYVNCLEPPYQKGEELYETGELTTTTIDLLDWADGASPLATSTGFREWTVQEEGVAEGVTINGAVLTDDLDVVVYIKGDKKAVYLYSAHLFLDYEPL